MKVHRGASNRQTRTLELIELGADVLCKCRHQTLDGRLDNNLSHYQILEKLGRAIRLASLRSFAYTRSHHSRWRQ